MPSVSLQNFRTMLGSKSSIFRRLRNRPIGAGDLCRMSNDVAMETVERRGLLTVTLTDKAFLQIDGTAGNDVAVVKVLDAASTQVEVDLNGEKTTWSLLNQVGYISFNGGDG